MAKSPALWRAASRQAFDQVGLGLLVAVSALSCGGDGSSNVERTRHVDVGAGHGDVATLNDAGSGEGVDGGSDVASDGDAGGGDAPVGDAAAADGGEPLVEFCEGWRDAMCDVEVDCCASRGYEVSHDVCTLPDRAAYLLQQPHCGGWLRTPDNFDPDAANRCVELMPEFYADCRPAARDTQIFQDVVASCEMVAPQPHPEPGEACGPLPCQAPPGMVSICDYVGGSGGISECFPPVPAQPPGAACGFCDVDLVCGVDGTCAAPLPRGSACNTDIQCESGYCDGTCTDAPPIAEARCELMQHLERHALYVEEGVGRSLAVTSDRIIWPGYYGPRGEGLHHAPKDGSGPIVHLASDESYSPTLIPVTDGTYAYDVKDGVADRTTLADGSREVLADVGFTAAQLAELRGDELVIVDGACTRLIWLSTSSGEIREHPANRDESNSNVYVHVSVDDVAAYCATGSRIVAFEHDGGWATITEEAVEPRGWITELVAVGGLLYYMVAGDPIEDRDQPRVIDPNTGEVNKLSPPTPVTALFADQTTGELFWTAEQSILRYHPSTGAFDTIELPASTTTNLVFDSEHFYWRFEQGIYRWPRR